MTDQLDTLRRERDNLSNDIKVIRETLIILNMFRFSWRYLMWLVFLVVEMSLTSSESEQGREKRGLAMEKACQAAKRREAALEAKVVDQRCDVDAPHIDVASRDVGVLGVYLVRV